MKLLLKTPKFWLKAGFVSWFLWPFSVLYRLGFAANSLWQKCSRLKSPDLKVICIGNLIAGGSGKTPVALLIGKILRESNIDFVYLSRGYGSVNDKIVKVENANKKAQEVGDEVILLSQESVVYAGKNRKKSLKEIAKDNLAKLVLMDDGMQNFSVEKDFSILVIDGKVKFGNGKLLPAGPLRQKIGAGLKNVDLIFVIGNYDEELRKILQKYKKEEKVIVARPILNNVEKFRQEKLVAFCGLAYPEKFFLLLEENGLDVAAKIEFADHYNYSRKELENLIEDTQKKSQKLVTTKKDWVKFDDEIKKKIDYLDLSLVIENENIVVQKILDKCFS